MPRWEEALDAQIDVYKMATSQMGRAHIEDFASRVTQDHPIWAGGGDDSLFSRLPERLATMTFNADPVYIDPDMGKLWAAAWPSFEPEPLALTDLVTMSGCLLLPQPLDMTDLHGKNTSTRLVLWAPVVVHRLNRSERPGIVLALFHGTGDTDDFSHPGERVLGSYMVQHVMSWTLGEDLRPSYEDDDGFTPTTVIRPIQCLWRLMSQAIAMRSQERPSRAFRKRAAIAFKDDERRVTVVRLRRTYEDRPVNHEVGGVEWSHRWIVGGHWRNHWYPSVQLHRQIWISPFVKGPPDKELIINKARVFELVR